MDLATSQLADEPVPRPKWNSGARAPASNAVHIDREQIIADLRSPTPTTAMEALRQEVAAHVQDPVDDFNDVLVQVASKYYPLKRPVNEALTATEALAPIHYGGGDNCMAAVD